MVGVAFCVGVGGGVAAVVVAAAVVAAVVVPASRIVERAPGFFWQRHALVNPWIVALLHSGTLFFLGGATIPAPVYLSEYLPFVFLLEQTFCSFPLTNSTPLLFLRPLLFGFVNCPPFERTVTCPCW